MSVSLSIDNSSFRIQKLSNKNNLNAYLIGDLVGMLNPDGSIKLESKDARLNLLDEIQFLTDYSKLSLNAYIGNFSLVAVSANTSELIVATSSSGFSPFVEFDNRHIKISFDENKLLRKHRSSFSEDSVEMMASSHQLVNRYPFHLVGIDSVSRLPSGHVSIFNFSKRIRTIIPFLNKEDFRYSTSCLIKSIDNILLLYKKYYGDDLALAFSGGLDSSCLASSFMKQSITIPFFHVDYKGPYSLRSRVAQYISNYLGFETQHIPRQDSRLTVDDMLNNCTSGYVSCPNLMYLGSPINRNTRNSLPKYLITGQGADSIYVVDGFAPATEAIGTKRIKMIVNSAKDRLALTSESISRLLEIPFSTINSVWPEIKANKKFYSLLVNQCVSMQEHVSYRNIKTSTKNNVESLREEWIAQKIMNQLPMVCSMKGNSILEVMRYIKWMRSLINVPLQYESAYRSQGIVRLTPFLEGPIVNMFFKYQLTSMESLLIKNELEHLFHSNAGIGHRSLVESAILTRTDNVDDYGNKLGSELSQSDYSNLANKVLIELSTRLKHTECLKLSKSRISRPEHLVRLASLLD